MLALSETLHNLHHSFDLLKAELLSHDGSITLPCGTTHSAPQTECTSCEAANDNSSELTSAVENWRRKYLEKADDVHRLQQQASELELKLDDLSATLEHTKAKLANVQSTQRTREELLQQTQAQLSTERKQVVVLSERARRAQGELAKLAEMKQQWETWTETFEGCVQSLQKRTEVLSKTNEEQSKTIAELRCADTELRRVKEELVSSESQRLAVTAELHALRRCGEDFFSTMKEAKQWIESGSAAVQHFVEERDRMRSEVERANERVNHSDERARALMLTITTLTAPIPCAPLLTDVQVQTDDCVATDGAGIVQCSTMDTSTSQAEQEEDFSKRSTNHGEGAHSVLPLHQQQLECRVLDLTLKLALAREERDALRRECTELRDKCVDVTMAVTLTRSTTDDEPTASSATEQLVSAVSEHACIMRELQQCVSSFIAMHAAPLATHDETSGSGSAPNSRGPQKWCELLDAAQHEITSQRETIQSLRGQLSSNFGTARSWAAAQSSTPSCDEQVVSRDRESLKPSEQFTGGPGNGSQLCCAVCGGCGAGSELASLWCKCRLCGDMFHRRCCHQSESLFVCHRHTGDPVGAPASRSAGGASSGRGRYGRQALSTSGGRGR